MHAHQHTYLGVCGIVEFLPAVRLIRARSTGDRDVLHYRRYILDRQVIERIIDGVLHLSFVAQPITVSNRETKFHSCRSGETDDTRPSTELQRDRHLDHIKVLILIDIIRRGGQLVLIAERILEHRIGRRLPRFRHRCFIGVI